MDWCRFCFGIKSDSNVPVQPVQTLVDPNLEFHPPSPIQPMQTHIQPKPNNVLKAMAPIRADSMVTASLIGKVLEGVATFVIDGDTFKFFHQVSNEPVPTASLKSQTITIRLAGVDAPETAKRDSKGQPGGDAAKRALSNLITNQRLTVNILDIDQYNRIVAQVTVNGANVALNLLEAGLVHLYTGKGAQYGNAATAMKEAARASKQQRIGMWASDHVETPADFKRKKFKQ